MGASGHEVPAAACGLAVEVLVPCRLAPAPLELEQQEQRACVHGSRCILFSRRGGACIDVCAMPQEHLKEMHVAFERRIPQRALAVVVERVDAGAGRKQRADAAFDGFVPLAHCHDSVPRTECCLDIFQRPDKQMQRSVSAAIAGLEMGAEAEQSLDIPRPLDVCACVEERRHAGRASVVDVQIQLLHHFLEIVGLGPGREGVNGMEPRDVSTFQLQGGAVFEQHPHHVAMPPRDGIDQRRKASVRSRAAVCRVHMQAFLQEFPRKVHVSHVSRVIKQAEAFRREAGCVSFEQRIRIAVMDALANQLGRPLHGLLRTQDGGAERPPQRLPRVVPHENLKAHVLESVACGPREPGRVCGTVSIDAFADLVEQLRGKLQESSLVLLGVCHCGQLRLGVMRITLLLKLCFLATESRLLLKLRVVYS
ncbi:hypothetical protein G6O67_004891 [Ophiocordyceps sinensis]|uniref:Uncharacterized protein n=1 Tax=Ophiocordyceps sinensis TaxID=72228 RepID=A0A8H4PQG3_9HYPO|nr:hypothetical protein G6O67_004891 [Ophiocordyceps sinensis]